VSAADPLSWQSWSSLTDRPAPLALQLEICRLRAELEVVEERLAAASGLVGPEAVSSPFAGRAAELVERLAESLEESVRNDFDLMMSAARATAERRLDQGRRHAQAILVLAREELASALIARADAVEAYQRRVLEAPLLAPPAPREEGPSPSRLDLDAVPIECVLDLTDDDRPAITIASAVPVTDVAIAAPDPFATEAARTDAAFETWIAVDPARAPRPGELVVVPLDDAADASSPARHRSARNPRWLVPVEIAASLAVVAVIVILLLILVG
jgi:hypothetical protein